MTECLNYNLISLREYLLSKSVDEISALSSIETDIQMLLPCELLLKLVAMTILTSHTLRLQGRVILEGTILSVDKIFINIVLLVIKSKLDCVLFNYTTGSLLNVHCLKAYLLVVHQKPMEFDALSVKHVQCQGRVDLITHTS